MTAARQLFVTGLCLQGNKGGQALALSIRSLLSERLGPIQMTLSVPASAFDREQAWAQRLGFEVVADPNPRTCLRSGEAGRLARAHLGHWHRAMSRAHAVIDMTAISYVGPPIGPVRRMLVGRFRYFATARLTRRPFVAWTQSYGPLSTPTTRRLARTDLSRQRVVFVRGEQARDEVLGILPDADVRAYPDAAVVLAHDVEQGRRVVGGAGADPASDDPGAAWWVTVSPSAVLYEASPGRGTANAHVRQLADVVQSLHDRGSRVLLVPHTLRLPRVGPESCDLSVAELVARALNANAQVEVLTADLSAEELKSVIAGARLHIGGRYHSIVASLSAGVPTVALSWHPKYRDLMQMYGQQAAVVEGTPPGEVVLEHVERLLDDEDAVRATLRERGAAVLERVRQNADEVAELLIEHLSRGTR